MVKRALLVVAAAFVLATVLAFTVSPISPAVAWAALTAAPIKEGPNTPAPRNSTKALKILEANVMKIASDYRHKRYRAVCADLTKKERKHFGGTSQCMMKIAVLNAFVPIKRFTIQSAKIGKSKLQAVVNIVVNGNKKHVIHAVVKWEGGKYRLSTMSGWHPKI